MTGLISIQMSPFSGWMLRAWYRRRDWYSYFGMLTQLVETGLLSHVIGVRFLGIPPLDIDTRRCNGCILAFEAMRTRVRTVAGCQIEALKAMHYEVYPQTKGS